jgi:CheY-like chemotaxis protein
LDVPITTLVLMMEGKVSIPADVFLQVVDLVVGAEVSSMGDPFVLVVEDDPATAYSFSRLIKQLGYRVKVTTDGHSALEHIRKLQPLIAFVDLRLPDMSGHEIAEIVRKERLKTRVVAVTGYGASPNDRMESLAAGFEEHFAKPVDVSSVETVIPRRNRSG